MEEAADRGGCMFGRGLHGKEVMLRATMRGIVSEQPVGLSARLAFG